MLALAASKGIRSWIEEFPMSYCNHVINELDKGTARYRYVLKADF